MNTIPSSFSTHGQLERLALKVWRSIGEFEHARVIQLTPQFGYDDRLCFTVFGVFEAADPVARDIEVSPEGGMIIRQARVVSVEFGVIPQSKIASFETRYLSELEGSLNA